jgi:metal-responsive CopG/Arc/MetJ family transcriptional regulator
MNSGYEMSVITELFKTTSVRISQKITNIIQNYLHNITKTQHLHTKTVNVLNIPVKMCQLQQKCVGQTERSFKF